MALEQLSGPHTIVDMQTSVNLGGMNQFALQWIDPAGLIAQATGHTYLVQMDGAAYDLAENILNLKWGLALVNGSPLAPLVGELRYSTLGFNGTSAVPVTEWALDRVTHLGTEVIATDAPGDILAGYAHVHDRFIRPIAGGVQFSRTAADAWATEAVLTGFSNGSFVSWARERGHVWLGGTAGHVVRYDYLNKVASSPVYRLGVTSGVIGLFYSPKHDVFVSVHQVSTTFQMRVWARTPLPASVSAPSASPAVAAGRASALSVRVLSADSEACPGEAVAWALTGAGTLAAAVTATDENGYATNRLVLPIGATGPSVRVDVEVTVP